MSRPRHARRIAGVGALALLAASAVPALATSGPAAGLSGGNLFLGTTKVEAGARANGSFGSTVAAPAGYHPRTQTGTILGFRVNPDECDWASGSCTTQGDFFTPGIPYESWGIQVGGGSPAFNNNTGTGIAGGFTAADAAAVRGVWQASAPYDGIAVRQTYAIPTYGWMIDAVVELTNTTGAPSGDVYVMRGLDPDNCRMESAAVCDSNGDGVADVAGTAGGGVYATTNTIVSQGAAGTSAVVTATQTNGTYLALRSSGADARVLVKNASFSDPANLASAWAGADGAFRSTAGASFGDTGIYAIVRVPSIAPGATASVRVQYVVKEIAPAADISGPIASTGGLIDVATRNGGVAPTGICDPPGHGSATIEAGMIRYTPAAGFAGTDTFTYSTGGPCGAVSVTVPAAAAPPAPAPHVVLTGPARRATRAGGGLRITQRLRIDIPGRYTFIYVDPTTGRRVRQLPGSTVGARTLGTRFSAPVLVTRKAGRRVVLVSRFGRVPSAVTTRMALRIVLRSPDGTVTDVTP